jgi:hypothetical protein
VSDGIVNVYVSNSWHYEPKAMRKQAAQQFQQIWALIYSPNDQDRAHIWLKDISGNKVGGSRAIGGSMIWIDD